MVYFESTKVHNSKPLSTVYVCFVKGSERKSMGYIDKRHTQQFHNFNAHGRII